MNQLARRIAACSQRIAREMPSEDEMSEQRRAEWVAGVLLDFLQNMTSSAGDGEVKDDGRR